MRSPDGLSWELEWWKHANTVCCGTERVGFGMDCELPAERFCSQLSPVDDCALYLKKKKKKKKKFGLSVPY